MRALRSSVIRHLVVSGGTGIVAAVAALAGSVPVTAAVVRAPASGGSWSSPRTLSVPRGYVAGSFAGLSCTSPLNCTAVGTYQDRAGRTRIFAVTKRHGIWGKGVRVDAPIRPFDPLVLLSCASAGNCAAATRGVGAYVVTENNGRWGKAQHVPGTGGAGASVLGIACPARGDCTAAGSTFTTAFLAIQRHGTWRRAFPVPGLTALTQPGDTSFIGELSCPSPGNCTATGQYGSLGVWAGFTVTEKHGIWGNAQPVPGGSVIYALSCHSPDNCAAAWPGPGSPGLYINTQTNGIWGTPQLLPGTAQLNGPEVEQIRCPAAGQCTVLGQTTTFSPGHDTLQPFVVVQKNGTWQNAQRIAGTGNGNLSATFSLSCPTAGNCALGGTIPAHGGWQAAFAAEENSTWGRARLLPGVLALDHGRSSRIEAVSCPVLHRCIAVGTFLDKKGTDGLPLATIQR